MSYWEWRLGDGGLWLVGAVIFVLVLSGVYVWDALIKGREPHFEAYATIALIATVLVAGPLLILVLVVKAILS